MFKKFFLSVVLVTAVMTCYSQNISSSNYSHYLGVQINPLMRQLVSFGSVPEVDNPFLIKYYIWDNASNRALTAGFGYSLDNTTDQDGFESSNNDLSLRLGVTQRKKIGKRFELGLGADLVMNSQVIKTVNVQANSFGQFIDSTITRSNSNLLGFGIGPQITLSFNVTDNIQFGTEMTYYYMYTRDKLNVETKNFQTDQFNGGLVESTSSLNEEDKSNTIDLNLPVALFLLIRF